MGLSRKEQFDRDIEILKLFIKEHWSPDDLARHFKLTVGRIQQILRNMKK